MKKNNKKGFTLVELVIVVAVMAVLVAVAIPTVGSIVNSAKSAVDESNARAIESVLKLKEAEEANANTEDGTVVLTTDKVSEAIAAAKLGIVGDSDGPKLYYYDTASGIVSTTGTKSATVYELSFAATTGVCTVTKGS